MHLFYNEKHDNANKIINLYVTTFYKFIYIDIYIYYFYYITNIFQQYMYIYIIYI